MILLTNKESIINNKLPYVIIPKIQTNINSIGISSNGIIYLVEDKLAKKQYALKRRKYNIDKKNY